MLEFQYEENNLIANIDIQEPSFDISQSQYSHQKALDYRRNIINLASGTILNDVKKLLFISEIIFKT